MFPSHFPTFQMPSSSVPFSFFLFLVNFLKFSSHFPSYQALRSTPGYGNDFKIFLSFSLINFWSRSQCHGSFSSSFALDLCVWINLWISLSKSLIFNYESVLKLSWWLRSSNQIRGRVSPKPYPFSFSLCFTSCLFHEKIEENIATTCSRENWGMIRQLGAFNY